ncbi:hypothetical protein FA95DRAFT_1466290, partial [Auriscalpium vulgare]
PSWMAEPLEVLRSLSDQRTWCAVLDQWVALEKALGLSQGKDKLPIDGRPEEVKVWFKGGRKPAKPPPLKSVSEYADNWLSWWTSMQPDWRKGDGSWPLERPVGDEAYTGWEALCRGGSHGFFIVIISLSWW